MQFSPMRRRTLIAGAALAGAAPFLVHRGGAADASIAVRFAAALSAHDIDAFAALFAEDYVNHQVSAAAPPPPAGVMPKAATVAFFAARLKAMPSGARREIRRAAPVTVHRAPYSRPLARMT